MSEQVGLVRDLVSGLKTQVIPTRQLARSACFLLKATHEFPQRRRKADRARSRPGRSSRSTRHIDGSNRRKQYFFSRKFCTCNCNPWGPWGACDGTVAGAARHKAPEPRIGVETKVTPNRPCTGGPEAPEAPEIAPISVGLLGLAMLASEQGAIASL